MIGKTADERLARNFLRNPDWTDKRRAKALGLTVAVVRAFRENLGANIQPAEAAGVPAEGRPVAAISIASVRERFDVAAAIKRELTRLGRGKILPEEELCRLTAGRDRNRFRRAVDNNPDLAKAHRIKMRLDDTGDGKFYWGGAAEIAEARKLYEG